MNRKLFSIGLACLITLFLLPDFVQAQDSRPIVRIIYFLPKDRQPQPDIDEKLDTLIKDVQTFYAEQMEAHGFGRKTFQIETDASGNAVVHHINGRFTDEYYSNLSWTWEIWEEIDQPFDPSKNIYLTVIDMSSPVLNCGGDCTVAGLGANGGGAGGKALIPVPVPASGSGVGLTAHELGHAFGLMHDNRRRGVWISTLGIRDRMITSFFAAEWLYAHRAFNPGQFSDNSYTAVEMLPPVLVSPPSTIGLRFEVTNPNGLHQVQLMTPEVQLFVEGGFLGGQALKGQKNATVEFVISDFDLTPKIKNVSLQMIDIHGNFSGSELYLIDVAALLPPSRVVSIPDPNLAAAVRRDIGGSITTHTMLNLRGLDARNRGIKHLTGLEHAPNLTVLNLGGEHVSGEGWMNSNRVSDFSSLSGLTQLTSLDLTASSLSDVSFLSALTNLTSLRLNNNNITDISALSALTNLNWLYLTHNNISDISALSTLTNLKSLNLHFNNNISDISALSTLTNLNWLNLFNNNISDISALSALTNLNTLNLSNNNISDISALSALTNLTVLYLYRNNISDISALSTLTNLNTLLLDSNNISDISGLSALTNLNTLSLNNNKISDMSPVLALNLMGTQWNSTGLHLKDNPLNNASIRTHIPAMQARGIVISFDNITHPEFLIISGDKQEELLGRTLPSPFVVEYRDVNGKPKEDVKVTFSIADGDAELTDTAVTTDVDGRAQTFLTSGWKLGTITVRATAEGGITPLTFTAHAVLPENHVAEDVNADGVVDVEDLVLVAATIGTIPPEGTYPNPDVNGDSVVNRDDLALVLAALETTPTAPAAAMTADNLQRWIDAAKRLTNRDETFQRGIAVLEELLSTLLPETTVLLANYPNPFNPETWIPYHLAKPAAVTVRIYGVNGTLIRMLSFGHKAAGIYEHRSRAAYWDGRNAEGEQVSSGVYFYTLTAGDYTSMQKMVLRK